MLEEKFKEFADMFQRHELTDGQIDFMRSCFYAGAASAVSAASEASKGSEELFSADAVKALTDELQSFWTHGLMNLKTEKGNA